MRWLAACLGASLFFWLVALAARSLWPLQFLIGPVELLLLPASVVTGLFVPVSGHHHTDAFYAVRSLMGGFGTVSAFLALREAWRLWFVVTERPVQRSRRTLLLQAFFATALGTACYGLFIEPNWLKLRRYEIALKGLPPELDGFKLGHISDTHYGPYISLSHIRRAIGLLNAEQPDLVLHTGDFVSSTPAAIPDGVGVLAGVRARLGTLAVLGNHDHWEGADAVRAELARQQVRLLDNDRLFLTANGLSETSAEGALAICGVGDLWEGVVGPAAALRDVPDGCPRLLLSHNPDVAEELEGPFDLQLSGHTHGGQVSFPGVGPVLVPSRFGPKYAGGLVAGPRWPVLVSRGVGMVMLPVRFRVPPEVSLIVLRSA